MRILLQPHCGGHNRLVCTERPNMMGCLAFGMVKDLGSIDLEMSFGMQI